MPTKMISEMPWPMPFSDMSSPSHIRNMVPDAIIAMSKSRMPTPPLKAPMPVNRPIMPAACRQASGMVQYFVHWAIFFGPSSSLDSFSRLGMTMTRSWKMIDELM